MRMKHFTTQIIEIEKTDSTSLGKKARKTESTSLGKRARKTKSTKLGKRARMRVVFMRRE